MISILQAVILGLLQGLTELFPISSLGHSVILPQLFGWHLHQNDNYFLTFLVATHLATATVLFIFFWKDWLLIIKGLLSSFRARRIDSQDIHAKVGWLLVVGTVPAGILGLLFQESLKQFFASARYAAAFLIVNGLILFGAEKLRTNNTKTKVIEKSNEGIAKLKWSQSIMIGTAQATALLPGISRSGTSMAGSLLAGLNNEEAARFSFLLATPVIGAAALLKLPDVFSSSYSHLRLAMLLGALSAAVAAYVSVRFLVRYFRTNTLKPFAVYCLLAGIMLSLYFAMK